MQLIKLVCVGMLCGVSGVGLACDLPPLVMIPAKEDAIGKEDAIRAETAKYFQAMQAYTQCVQAALVAAGGDAAPTITKAVLVRRNNAAVAEAEAVLKAFTERVGPIAQSGPPAPAK
jgi:hypothetical protein